jgi:hypothetical protein
MTEPLLHVCAAFAGMTVAQQGSLFARNFVAALLPIMQQWLGNAKASYTAMTTLLGQVPGVGAQPN